MHINNGSAERFVGSFKISVIDLRPYRRWEISCKERKSENNNLYNHHRSHEVLEGHSPLQDAQQHRLEDIPALYAIVASKKIR